MKRVAVTGMAGVTSLGSEWKDVRERLLGGRSAVTRMPAWKIEGMRTQLGAPVVGFEVPGRWPRKKARSMGPDSQMAVRASELALERAGLLGSPLLEDGSTGVAYGSTAGSPSALSDWADRFFVERTIKGIPANEFIRFMSHTCASNISVFFGTRGRLIPSCSACTSGSQGIGFGYEAIRHGQQTIMLAGGAEELGALDAAVFDVLFAASTRNDEPDKTPRPFDVDRDGIVCSEGACTFVLEELEHARARGAEILAEVVGFATNSDGRHITNPTAGGMEAVMRQGLESAGLEASEIDYVNLHGTGTDVGDIAESTATFSVFGDAVPASSLKSYLGHALGACGSIEAWLAIEMMNEGWFSPNLNLDNLDERCAPLDYIRGEPRALAAHRIMSNNFAFGGVNTSLVFAGPEPA